MEFAANFKTEIGQNSVLRYTYFHSLTPKTHIFDHCTCLFCPHKELFFSLYNQLKFKNIYQIEIHKYVPFLQHINENGTPKIFEPLARDLRYNHTRAAIKHHELKLYHTIKEMNLDTSGPRFLPRITNIHKKSSTIK